MEEEIKLNRREKRICSYCLRNVDQLKKAGFFEKRKAKRQLKKSGVYVSDFPLAKIKICPCSAVFLMKPGGYIITSIR